MNIISGVFLHTAVCTPPSFQKADLSDFEAISPRLNTEKRTYIWKPNYPRGFNSSISSLSSGPIFPTFEDGTQQKITKDSFHFYETFRCDLALPKQTTKNQGAAEQCYLNLFALRYQRLLAHMTRDIPAKFI
jgi:hypothetical protein